RTIVLMVLLQAVTPTRAAMATASTRLTMTSSEAVGPNVVFGLMARPGAASQVGVGLIETMRVTGGRVPWLGRHLDRLHASIAALGGSPPGPPAALVDLVRSAVEAGSGDYVVRLELTDGQARIAT